MRNEELRRAPRSPNEKDQVRIRRYAQMDRWHSDVTQIVVFKNLPNCVSSAVILTLWFDSKPLVGFAARWDYLVNSTRGD